MPSKYDTNFRLNQKTVNEDFAAKILSEKELEIEVDLGLDLRGGVVLAISLIIMWGYSMAVEVAYH